MEASAVSLPRVRSSSARFLRLADDERLVALVRAGNETAFEAIYDRHHRPILSFCRHMLSSREDAEDAVQQTFLSAYRSLKDSDNPIQLRAWLFTIARNRCLSVLRSRRQHVDVEDHIPATEGLGSEVQRRQDLREVLEDMARLPDDQRAALVLAELGALEHEEIARVLDCQREKVKSLVFQARSSLAASRKARETPCEQIREELSTLRGSALRRSHLRRHLRDCPGCRDFQGEVRRQRGALALLLPVLPTPGLKHAVVSGAIGSAGGGGAAGGGLGALGGLATKAAALKATAALAIATGATAGGVAIIDGLEGPATGAAAGGGAAKGAAVRAGSDASASAQQRAAASRRRAARTTARNGAGNSAAARRKGLARNGRGSNRTSAVQSRPQGGSSSASNSARSSGPAPRGNAYGYYDTPPPQGNAYGIDHQASGEKPAPSGGPSAGGESQGRQGPPPKGGS